MLSPSAESARSSRSGKSPSDYNDLSLALLRPPLELASPRPPRSLSDVRLQVAQETAVNIVVRAKDYDGVKTNVKLITSKFNDEEYLYMIASKTNLTRHLIAVGVQLHGPGDSTLIIYGSSQDLIERASVSLQSKFIGRIKSSREEENMWVGTIYDLGGLAYDEEALWDVLRRAARTPMDPVSPPLRSKGADQMLTEARAKLERITAQQAFNELKEPIPLGAPAYLVDIRPQEQRNSQGVIPGALVVDRNSLEWCFDPRSTSRLSIADRYDLRVMVLCQNGRASSLAAHALQQLGLLNATDIIGGFEAWKDAGLPADFTLGLNTREEPLASSTPIQSMSPARTSSKALSLEGSLARLNIV